MIERRGEIRAFLCRARVQSARAATTTNQVAQARSNGALTNPGTRRLNRMAARMCNKPLPTLMIPNVTASQTIRLARTRARGLSAKRIAVTARRPRNHSRHRNPRRAERVHSLINPAISRPFCARRSAGYKTRMQRRPRGEMQDEESGVEASYEKLPVSRHAKVNGLPAVLASRVQSGAV